MSDDDLSSDDLDDQLSDADVESACELNGDYGRGEVTVVRLAREIRRRRTADLSAEELAEVRWLVDWIWNEYSAPSPPERAMAAKALLDRLIAAVTK
jgi:nitrogen regulatory protein PII-like uncharacterized protein